MSMSQLIGSKDVEVVERQDRLYLAKILADKDLLVGPRDPTRSFAYPMTLAALIFSDLL